MAILHSVSNGNFTSASTWEVVNPTASGSFLIITNIQTVTTTFVGSPTFSPGVVNFTGVWLCLGYRLGTTGTFDVQLYNSTLATQSALVTVNMTDIPSHITINQGRGLYFRFSSGVTLSSTQSYQLRLRTSTANMLNMYYGTAVNNYTRLFTTSTTATPSSGDLLYINGLFTGAGASTPITVTMNNNNSTEFGAISIGDKGTLDWVTNATTELRLAGEAYVGANISLWINGGTYRMGTTSSRIQPGVTASLFINAGVANGRRIQVNDLSYFTTAGSTMSYTWTTLSTDMATFSFTATTSVATGWNVGDTIVIAPTARTFTAYDRRVLTNVSGTTLTMGVSASNFHSGTGIFAGEVINLTRNCRILCTNPLVRTYITQGAATSIIQVDSTEFVNMGAGAAGVGVFYLNGGGITSSNTIGTQSIKDCSFNDCGVALYLTLTGTTTTSYYNVIMDNCVYNTRYTTGGLFYQPTAPTSQPALAVNSYISNNCLIFGGTSSAIIGIYCLNNTIDIENNRVSGVSSNWGYQYGQASTYIISEKFNNNVAHSNIYGFAVFFRDTLDSGFHPTGNKSIRNTFGWTIYGSVNSRIDDLTSIGNTSNNLYGSINTLGSNKLYFNNALIQGEAAFGSIYGLYLASTTYPTESFSTQIVFNNCNIGTHSGGDIRIGLAASVQPINLPLDLVFNNCNLTSAIEVSQPNYMSSGSRVAFQRIDNTVGAHRTYYRNGLLSLDTTIFRSTTKSSKMTPSSATIYQQFGKKLIPVKANSTPTISVWVRKSVVGDGSAYNGSQPRLWLTNNPAIALFPSYDDIILATASAANGTWEQLSATLPVVPYEDTAFEVYLDCRGTTGWVNVDDWRISQ
jgi:hypothetical protein